MVKAAKRKTKKTARQGRVSGEVVIFITAPSLEEAQKIAHTLVAEHLAACVNILSPIQSVFYWEGKICDEKETLLVCKSQASVFEGIRKRVVQLHSYTVPEIIALPIIKGSKSYLDWVREVTRGV